MVNPVARVYETQNSQGVKQYRSVMTYCPACEQAHPFIVELYPGADLRSDGSPQPVWSWNGDLERPTFSPSMLCYSSVHICKGEHPPKVCEDPDNCGQKGHMILSDNYKDLPESEWVRGHPTPHTRDPAWGDCHSFLQEGVWQFLGDCAHSMAGQQVPMVPLPDWLAGKE